MAIPNVVVTVTDGALGLQALASPGASAKIGVSAGGVANTVYSFNDLVTATATLVSGPLLEAVAHQLTVAGGPVLAVPVTASNPGTSGTVTLVGTGPNPGVTVSVGAALDSFSGIVKITLGGAIGTSQFQYSLDGGDTYSQVFATAATFAIPNSGLTIAFTAGTYVAGDLYSWLSVGPSFALADLATATSNLIADVRPWNWIHVVGTATGVGATAVTNFQAIESGINTTITGAITSGRFTFALLEMPDVTDAQAFVDTTASTRLMTALGYAELISQVTGRISKRSAAWTVSARMAKTTVARDPGAVIDGSLPGITASVDQPLGLWRDENISPGGDAAGFVTLRKYAGGPNGYYVTTGRTRAAAGSDYVYISNRRVMDLACAIARPALTKYINSNVRVDPLTGFIDPRDANNIEADLNGQLRAALISPQPQQASDVSVVVNRAANILSTGILPVSVRVTPLGYVRQLTLEIGFFNPALVAKAA